MLETTQSITTYEGIESNETPTPRQNLPRLDINKLEYDHVLSRQSDGFVEKSIADLFPVLGMLGIPDTMPRDEVEGLPEESSETSGSAEVGEEPEELQRILLKRNEKLNQTCQLIGYIEDSKTKAVKEDELFEEEQVAKYSAKYRSIGLPVVHNLMNLDEVYMKACGLIVTDETLMEGGTKEGKAISMGKAATKSLQKKQIPSIERTVSGTRYGWLPRTRKSRNIKVSQTDLLDESDDLGIPQGGIHSKTYRQNVEQSHQRPIGTSLQMAEQRALHGMNSRITFLRNPRFPVSPSKIHRLPPSYDLRVLDTNGAERKQLESDIKKTPAHTKLLETASDIQAIPSTIYFHDYHPQKVYTAMLELKNTSMHSHRFRVTCTTPETSSPYFSIQRLSSPTDNYGLIAPGMSCRYRITFTPDTLANYEHVFVVHPEQSAPFNVPVIACRDPPLLTLPATLDCGPCQAGCTAKKTWIFENIGGPGKFLVFRKDEVDGRIDVRKVWDNVPDELKHRQIEIGPFKICDSFFSIGNDASQKLIIHYFPSPVLDENRQRHDAESFMLACDNCQMIEISLKGLAQVPAVTLVSIHASASMPASELSQSNDAEILQQETDGGEATVGNLKSDENDQREGPLIIDFGIQNTHGQTSRFVTVRNRTLLTLPFKWRTIDNPGDNRPRTARTVTGDPASTRALNNDHIPLWIKPNKGNFSPGGDLTFTVSFTPQEIKNYDICAELYLLPSDFSFSLPSTKKKDRLEDLTGETQALSIKCIGNGVPYRVEAYPCYVHVPYVIPVGDQYNIGLRLTNRSISNVHYTTRIENIDPTILQVKAVPDAGVLLVHTCQIVKIGVYGIFPGKVQGRLVFLLDTGDTLMVPIHAEVGTGLGCLNLKTRLLEFGLFELGQRRKLQAPLINSSGANLHWTIAGYSRSEGTTSNIRGTSKMSPSSFTEVSSRLTFQPSSGYLQSGEQIEVEVTYDPVKCERFRGLVVVSILREQHADFPPGVPNSSSSTILSTDSVIASCLEIRAEVQTPLACFDNCCIQLPHSYVGIPAKTSVLLRNLTLLPTKFQWIRVPTEENHEFEAKFDPDCGVLSPGEERKISLELTPLTIGIFRDLLFACRIKGMQEGSGVIGICVAIDVGGLEVKFDTYTPLPTSRTNLSVISSMEELPSSGLQMRAKTLAHIADIVHDVHRVDYTPSELSLDFGTNCQIFSRNTVTLIISNLSSIAASFNLKFENYPAWQQKRDDVDHPNEESARTVNCSTSFLASTSKYAAAAVGLERSMLSILPDQNFGKYSLPALNSKAKSTSSKHQLLKASTTEQQRFHSVTGQTYSSVVKQSRHAGLHDQEMLQYGSGAAFLAVPSHGRLEPHESVHIQITAYNNLCGVYKDELLVSIENWLEKSIPLTMGVVGSPIKFVGRSLAVSDFAADGSPCRLNFGTRILNNQLASEPMNSDVPGVVTKVVQVENQSPKTIILDWRVYCTTSGGPNTAADGTGRTEIDLGGILQKENSIEDKVPPFTIYPRGMSIPAFQTHPVSISFASPTVGIFSGAICAGIQVREKDGTRWKNAHEPATRPGSASVDKSLLTKVPVILRVQGKSTVPKITLDCGDRIRLKIRRPHKLFDSFQTEPDEKSFPPVSRIITLTNTTDAEFGFTLQTSVHFRAVLNPSPEQLKRQKRHTSTGKETGLFDPLQHCLECELLPKEFIMMTLYFDPKSPVASENPDRIARPSLSEQANEGNEKRRPSHDPESVSPVFQGELGVHFTNGSIQTIPLAAEILCAM